MSLRLLLMRGGTRILRLIRKIKPAQVFVIGFLLIILAGTLLLMLPVASRADGGKDFITALFTAVSAACVTGTGVGDIDAIWSLFGQVVIMLLLQLGGLGFMSMLSIFYFFFKRSFGLRHRLVMVQSLNLKSMSGVVRMTKHILIGTLVFEGAGALILSARFIPDMGFWDGLRNGVFLSVSAFCNAGIDLLETYGGLRAYTSDFMVNTVVMVLITVGGIGFFVWEDLWEHRGLRGTQVYTRLVLIVSASLTVGGAILYYLFEAGNPGTLGPLGSFQRVQAALFQSVSMRTAGFAMLTQSALTEGSKALSLILMFVGASSGSTGGGVKVVTIAVLLLSSYAALRGRGHAVVFGRMIRPRQVTNALALFVVALLCTMTGAFAIALYDGIPFFDALFEAASAFSTAGVSLGGAATFSLLSKFVLMFLMFFGRIGILTLGFAVLSRREDRAHVTYPDVQLMIG